MTQKGPNRRHLKVALKSRSVAEFVLHFRTVLLLTQINDQHVLGENEVCHGQFLITESF